MSKTKKNPLVSIIIPVYNGGNYLNQAINSALAQTYGNIEILVVNDGSIDGGITRNVAKAYGDRIRYFEKENGGVSTALNFGIQNMKGEYFSWLSHDDMYTPNKIKAEMSVIEEKGECIVGCNVLVTSQDGTVFRKNKLSNKKEKSIKCFMALDTDTGLNGCTLLIPKKGFEEFGGFNAQLKCTQDYDMWFRLANKYAFFFTEEYGVLSRQHDAQDSRTKTDICLKEADRLHSSFLKNITLEEMKCFLDGDIEYLRQKYNIYKNAGYLKTSAQIAIHIWNIEKKLASLQKITEDIFSDICGYKDKLLLRKTVGQVSSLRCMEKIKPVIMFYSNVWTKGGIERVLSILFPELIDEYQIVLVSNYIENEKGFAVPDAVVHIKVDSQLNEKLPYGLLVLALLTKTDVFVGNPNIINAFLDVYELMEDSGIRTIACNHGYYFIPYWAKWIYPVAERRKEVYPVASAVTWLTSFSAYLGKMISDNGILMPNPNFFSEHPPKKYIGQSKNILVVGRFYDDIKRVDRALKVFREVVKKHEDAKLYLVGGYNLDMHVPIYAEQSLKELIQELNFPRADNVVWVGEVNDLTYYYEKATVLMMTSDNEGFSMVLNEAGIFGVPQVLFDIPGLTDLVENGENGFIVPQDDIIGMAEKICLVLGDDKILRKMSLRAQSMAGRYDKRLVADRWKKLFRIVMQNRNKDELNYCLNESFPLNNKISLKELRAIVSVYNSQIKRITNQENIRPEGSDCDPWFAEPIRQSVQTNECNPCTNCREVIYQSNSWRITKPLRWISLTIKSLKNDGILSTGKKIKRRFILKFYKEAK